MSRNKAVTPLQSTETPTDHHRVPPFQRLTSVFTECRSTQGSPPSRDQDNPIRADRFTGRPVILTPDYHLIWSAGLDYPSLYTSPEFPISDVSLSLAYPKLLRTRQKKSRY